MDNYRVKKLRVVNGHYCADIYVNDIKVKTIIETSAHKCMDMVDRFVYEIECDTWRNYVNPIVLKRYDSLINKRF